MRRLTALVVACLFVGGAAQSPAAAEVDPDGRTFAWGRNSFGQLGEGGTTDRHTPAAVGPTSGGTPEAVVGGNFHTLALTADGRVRSWGRNNYGQLGEGSTTSRATPGVVHLPEEDSINEVAAGSAHSLALTSDGRVLSWGRNHLGQLGDGGTTSRATPSEVDLPRGVSVTDVAAGAAHSLALTADGTLLAWGDNSYGQLGDGTTTNRSTPVEIRLPAAITITELATGGLYHSLALTDEGHLLSWGRNNYGQVGDGTDRDRVRPRYVDLPEDVTVTQAGVGGWHSLAVTEGGRVLSWGQNTFGQLGDSTKTARNAPTHVTLAEDTTVAEVATGSQYHSLARTTDGRVLAWGANSSGELGDGTTEHRDAPVETALPDEITVTGLGAGYRHVLALAEPADERGTEE